MPKISLDKERVLKIIGKKISDKELSEKIPYLGTDLESVNEKIEVEIFPNRPDMLSLEGFSRSLSSFLGIKKGLTNYLAKESKYEVIVEESVKKIRPYTVCCVVKGLQINQSILDDIIEMQEKLHITHGRNRKKCAIGIYPLDKINFPITYLAKKPEEIKFKPLGYDEEWSANKILEKHEKGKQFKDLMKEKYPLFIDNNKKILSMPPIINSEDTGNVTIKTTDVFIECSGTDLENLNQALNIIVTSLIDIGGEAYKVKVKYEDNLIITPNLNHTEMKISFEEARKLIGMNLTDKEIIESLEKMGYSYKDKKVLIPCYRADILHEVDIIEDIAIGYGYNNLNGETTKIFTPGKQNFIEITKNKLREILIGLELIENVSYNITKNEIQKKYFNNTIQILNSTTKEYDSLRTNITISLLNNLELNKKNNYPQKIFELGRTFKIISNEIIETENLSIALAGEDIDYTKIKSYLDAISTSIGVEFEIEKNEYDHLIKGRSAKISLNKKEIGFIGEIKPELLNEFNLFVPVSVLEFNVENLF